jgi:hypothetical protein
VASHLLPSQLVLLLRTEACDEPVEETHNRVDEDEQEEHDKHSVIDVRWPANPSDEAADQRAQGGARC